MMRHNHIARIEHANIRTHGVVDYGLCDMPATKHNLEPMQTTGNVRRVLCREVYGRNTFEHIF